MIPIRYGDRLVGRYDPQARVFSKNVKRSRHLFQALNAWAIQEEVWRDLVRRGCQRVVVKDTENAATFSTTADTLAQRGFVKDFGHGAQRFLPLKHWDQEGAEVETGPEQLAF